MSIILPIFICVVLPISIVLIFALTNINSDNKRAQILIKAIESNNSIDANLLSESLQKPKKTALEILNLRLLRGCIFSLLGLLFLIIVAIMSLSGGHDSDTIYCTLMTGGASFAVGISYLIVYRVTRKQL